ncbi:ABC transporter ATP-binding protein [Nodosilinea sp. P-1105]|uniref:ABC transporter ATP-binding protein n=1 Tax=Nodosilinea sp. P-1105 TaxID=2546229 RepID=UPI00146E6D93|nr:ABC transporter ATP-binding protein [Nodosilinea sp. P-1105]NMF85150.1 ABC transporter ATP-binding protein [Nodosilinea sp. P-1105]
MQANMIRKIAERDPVTLQTEASVFQLYGRLLGYVFQHRGGLVMGFISIVGVSLLQVLIPQITRYVIDTLIPAQRFDLLIWVGLSIVAIALLLGTFNFLKSYSLALVGQRTIYQLRNDLYQHLQKLSLGYFENQRTGALMARLTQDVDSLQTLITADAAELIAEIVTFSAVVTYLFYADWSLTLMILATLPIMVGLTQLFGTRMRGAYRQAREQGAEVSNHLQETLTNMKVIKACANEGYEIDRFSDYNQQNLEANVRVVKLWSAFSPVIDFMNYLGYVIVLVYGAWEVMRGRLTIGEMTAFLAYLGQVNQPAKKFSKLMHALQKAAAACERLFETLDTEPDIQEKPDALELPPVQGNLKFESVDFAYSPGQPVLQQFSLEIQPGTTVALVGPSGAGKSTIASLATRFYDPQKGRILMDGYDLRDLTFNSLRRQMGIVSQETLLIYGTVRDNIAYGKPGVTDETIEVAARAAHAHEFITALPQGYDTLIGERGVKLSGGQRQRLAIARALVKDPAFLILDEATSSLDTESEALIQAALDRLMHGEPNSGGDRTCLVIAHRLSTVQKADCIVVLEHGQIVEMGTHVALLARQGRYADLCQGQFFVADPSASDLGIVNKGVRATA